MGGIGSGWTAENGHVAGSQGGKTLSSMKRGNFTSKDIDL